MDQQPKHKRIGGSNMEDPKILIRPIMEHCNDIERLEWANFYRLMYQQYAEENYAMIAHELFLNINE
jgi:hypothetical protein